MYIINKLRKSIEKIVLTSIIVILALSLTYVLTGPAGINVKIMYAIRLPELIMLLCIGILLSCSGLLLQVIFRNPLVEPYTTGSISGALFAITLTMYITSITSKSLLLIFRNPWILTISSFLGSLCINILLLVIYRFLNLSIIAVVLLGICISMFLSSISILMTYFMPIEFSHYVISWHLGSIMVLNNVVIALMLVITITSILVTYYLSPRLDLYMLGDDYCIQRGYSVSKLLTTSLITSSIATSIVVSTCGVVGFIGLIVPHISRLIVGNLCRNVLITSILIAPIISITSGILSKILLVPYGIVVSVIGTPIFTYLVVRQVIKSVQYG